jgi:hypothetical protein
MYTASNWLQPQIYADPNQSAIVTPPNGWGLQVVPKPAKRGMGLFDSGDWTAWGWGEWLTLAAGAYFLIKLVGDVGAGAGTVRRKVRRRKARQRKRDSLLKELGEI